MRLLPRPHEFFAHRAKVFEEMIRAFEDRGVGSKTRHTYSGPDAHAALRFRRHATPKSPIRPMPSRTSVQGSGTVAGVTPASIEPRAKGSAPPALSVDAWPTAAGASDASPDEAPGVSPDEASGES